VFPGAAGFFKRPHGTGRAPTLDAMTAPEVGAHRPLLDAAVSALALQVDRHTVLAARAALLAEADRLDTALRDKHSDLTAVGLCGGDPVSPEAALAFNERINGLVTSCLQYNRDLRASASALDATARSYGFTDDEISASFQPSS
jgi:PE family